MASDDNTGPVVIVGAGQGGLQVAASLRQAGFAGPVVLIGDEPWLPYQRPPLSKTYVTEGRDEALWLRPESFFDAQQIDYRRGTRVLAIDRAARRVDTTAGPVAYGQLVLATGARNARPPIPGLDRAHDLRTLADAQHLRDIVLGPQRRFGVIGGGFIGLEFAAVARKYGHHVVVAEAAPRLMSRSVSPQMSEAFAQLHQNLGNDIRLGQAVTAVTPDGMILDNGERIDADHVLLAAGVRPNVELAEAAGLDVDNGIVVDGQLLTTDPAISAMGDCASFPDPRSGRRVRLESVQAAIDHARHIVARLTGAAPGPYAALPWFWSDQADWKLQIAGLAMPEDRAEQVADHVVFRFDALDLLTAVETVNGPRVHMKARKLLGTGMLDPAQARALLT
ncbi:FAD/NAD(P)-binding oxidoreductase [uncultured Paracoccus sp.]|uniref:NAD(P)/FAD-dependent oxidoreductase n=1 Tax=uncultured Paracoccus sp. TaxID=189685 RepID=UPI0026158528|nr:FAD/NAD(P)-binding oxidoreductase [uncultured Paracoccus sp.]